MSPIERGVGDPREEVIALRRMVKRLEAELHRCGATWPEIGAIERDEEPYFEFTEAEERDIEAFGRWLQGHGA